MEKSNILEPEALEALIAVGETRSFTEAARLLNRSQSTVSASIQRLEKGIGARLVNRTTRSVTLTADGEEMLRYARMVSELSEQARRRFLQPNLACTVRLGVFTNFDSPALATALRELNTLHPSVQVKVETARSDILLARLRDRTLDIVLATRQPGHAFGEPLLQDDLVWIGTNDIPKSIRQPIPLAVRVRPSMLRRLGVEALNVAGRSHVVAFEGNSLPSVAAAVDAGLAFSIFSRSVRPPHIPVIEQPSLLPRLGWIDFVLLKAEDDQRVEVTSFYGIIRDLAPQIFSSISLSIFGTGPSDRAPLGSVA